MGGRPLLLEWHGSAMISRIVWEFVEGFLERISRLLGSDGGRKSVPVCCCPWEKQFIGNDARWHNSKCISSTVSSTACRTLEFIHGDSCQTMQTLVEQRQTNVKGKGKVNHAPQESIDGCSSPSSSPWARRWRTTNVCDAWPVWCQPYGYLPSRKASPPIG